MNITNHTITAQANTNYSMNNVFANSSNEVEIYPFTVKEIAKALKLDRLFKATALKKKYEKTLIENTPVFSKNVEISSPPVTPAPCS